MISECESAYVAARAAHWEIGQDVERVRVALGTSSDMFEVTDAIYAMKETSKLLEEMRKETNRLVSQLERVACQLWSVTDGDPIRTPQCTGSPDVKQTVVTPKKGTPEYRALCLHYGVDPDGPFSPDWKRMIEQITAEQSQGKPLPPGCDPNAMMTIFSVRITKKKPVVAEDAAPPVQNAQGLAAMAKLFAALMKIDLSGLHALKNAQEEYDGIMIVENEDDTTKVPVAATDKSEEDVF